MTEDGGQIVIAIQVVEAAVDVSSAILWTEIVPPRSAYLQQIPILSTMLLNYLKAVISTCRSAGSCSLLQSSQADPTT